MSIPGLFRDELAKFIVKNRRIVSKDSVVLRVSSRMIPGGSWGEDFVPLDKFPPSFCVMVGKESDLDKKKTIPVVKPYTPIESDSDHFDLLVKKYPNGIVSQALFSSQPGDVILMQGPRSKFLLPFKEPVLFDRIIAIAGGTGITPIFQILKYLEKHNNPSLSKFHLIYANKGDEDILLKEELDDLLRGPLKNILTIEHVVGKLLEAEHIPTSRGDKDFVMICGPPGFNTLLLGDSEHHVGLLKDFSIPNQIFKF